MNEPRAYPDRRPDEEGRVVRAVCGLLLGVALGLGAWSRARCGLWPGLALVVAFMAGCAYASARHGDTFWYRLLRRRVD